MKLKTMKRKMGIERRRLNKEVAADINYRVSNILNYLFSAMYTVHAYLFNKLSKISRHDFIWSSYRVYMGFIWSSYSLHIAFIYLSYRNRLKTAFCRSLSLTEYKMWLGNPRYTGKSPPRCPVFPK